MGSRGIASRLGSKDSGICAKANGWNVGVYVVGTYDEKTKQDIFRIYRTSGSNDTKREDLLMTIYEHGMTEINKVIQK
jgi:hypothetical protein